MRAALLWALRRQKSQPDFLVSVETLDDVTFETAGGDATDLLQTKHHLSKVAALTDASVDLWKTLRIWFEGHASGEIPVTANLVLVTTGSAPSGSAASRLRCSGRDAPAAQKSLDTTAASSTNKANAKCYKAYLAVHPTQRASLLDRVLVVDAAATIDELGEELRLEVYWAAGKEHHGAFLDRLEGWWFRRVLVQLASPTGERIGAVELEAQMADLREQFKKTGLPIDDDLLEFTLDEVTHAAYQENVFVRQLELIKAGKGRVAAAIRDYYRAYEQRSRWLRDDLVVGIDLHKYELRLVEEWELVFDAMRDELGEGATRAAKQTAARAVLQWAEQATLPIRADVTEPFVSRGSLHMLSDDVRIGWHPEFRELLASVLGQQQGAAS
ncbi:MAG: hypothetical protein GY937_16605 [bacterium]|nr:hypothetical protein [bacterium]